MKKAKLLSIAFILLFFSILHAQTKVFQYQGLSIGHVFPTSDSAYTNVGVLMPEVKKIGSQYIMYYTTQAPGKSGISYATSQDMINWDVQDTIFNGSLDTANREYVIGGQSVVKLNTGQYRMFYRCAQKHTTGEPKYHIRSAISSDGINFTKEGIRIEIAEYQTGSYFTFVGQSAFYTDSAGNLSALLTAKDTSMNTGMAPRIYYATSPNQGLTWNSFTPLYTSCHDPVVIKDSTGMYRAYFTFLTSGYRTVTSSDGITWQSTTDTLKLIKNGNPLDELNFPKTADLGASVDSIGNIYIYSNYTDTIGDWNIAYFKQNSVLTNLSTNTKNKNSFIIYPNPADNLITLKINNELVGKKNILSILDQTGKRVISRTISSEITTIDITELCSGIYFINIDGESPQTFKIIKK